MYSHAQACPFFPLHQATCGPQAAERPIHSHRFVYDEVRVTGKDVAHLFAASNQTDYQSAFVEEISANGGDELNRFFILAVEHDGIKTPLIQALFSHSRLAAMLNFDLQITQDLAQHLD